MPLYVMLDIAKDGRIYAWVNDLAGWAGTSAKANGATVSQTLRALASKLATKEPPK